MKYYCRLHRFCFIFIFYFIFLFFLFSYFLLRFEQLVTLKDTPCDCDMYAL